MNLLLWLRYRRARDRQNRLYFTSKHVEAMLDAQIVNLQREYTRLARLGIVQESLKIT